MRPLKRPRLVSMLQGFAAKRRLQTLAIQLGRVKSKPVVGIDRFSLPATVLRGTGM